MFSGECGEDAIKEAAEFGTSQLAAKLGSDVHFTLSYVESAKTQVGYLYIKRFICVAKIFRLFLGTIIF